MIRMDGSSSRQQMVSSVNWREGGENQESQQYHDSNEHPTHFFSRDRSSVRGNLTEDLCKDIVFDSLNEAGAWYNEYAKLVGFGVRKQDYRKLKDGRLVSYIWVCAKEGKRNPKWNRMENRKRRPRPETRDWCPAKFRVNLDCHTQKWVIKELNHEHNHPVAEANHVKFIRCHRTISDGDKAIADAMRSVGIETRKIMQFLALQRGGYNKVDFMPRDLHNHLYRSRQTVVSDGDAAGMLGYLNCRKDREGGFYFIHQEKSDGTLGNVFWADAVSRADYVHFGDVIAFDSCYRRNMYNTPLVIIIGVNNHHQSIVFGGAILQNEEAKSYEWLLTEFLACMGNKEPMGVVTDGDRAMAAAVGAVLPKAIHRICAWHVLRNVPTFLKCGDFLDKFQSCVMDRMEEDVFEQKWATLVEEYDLHENSWMNYMYSDRNRWSEAFLQGIMFAGFKTTSRCEGMHAFMDDFLDKGMNLLEFVKRYDMGIEKIRYVQSSNDHDMEYEIPVQSACHPSFQTQGSEIFTPKSFVIYKEEIEKSCSYLTVGDKVVRGHCVTYNIRRSRSKYPPRTIIYEKAKAELFCSCKLLQCNGFPCRHMVRVAVLEEEDRLPASCFLQRWTKNAKKGSLLNISSLFPSTDFLQQVRQAALAARCNNLCKIASTSDKAFDDACIDLQLLERKIQESIAQPTDHQEKGINPYANVGDPRKVRTKGMPRTTKGKHKARKRCSICKEPGHTKTTCNLKRSVDKDAYPPENLHGGPNVSSKVTAPNVL